MGMVQRRRLVVVPRSGRRRPRMGGRSLDTVSIFLFFFFFSLAFLDLQKSRDQTSCSLLKNEATRTRVSSSALTGVKWGDWRGKQRGGEGGDLEEEEGEDDGLERGILVV